MTKVLLIDDDQRNIFALRAVLQSRNIDCVTASRAEDGLSIVRSDKSIDLILLDMMMPGMDGYEAIAEVRRSERNSIPVIAVTAQAMAGDRDKCLSAGANEYLAKPIDVDALMEAIHRLAGR